MPDDPKPARLIPETLEIERGTLEKLIPTGDVYRWELPPSKLQTKDCGPYLILVAPVALSGAMVGAAGKDGPTEWCSVSTKVAKPDIAPAPKPAPSSIPWKAISAALVALVMAFGAGNSFQGCQKPVDPTPTPVDPKVIPIPDKGFRVLMVYESADLHKMPSAQVAAMKSKAVLDYLNLRCVEVGGVKEWRCWDQNVSTAEVSSIWQKAMARPRTSLPWLVISNGVNGWEGPLPADADKLLEKLKEFGGV